MRCRQCGLVNPVGAQLCQCGYNFITGATTGAIIPPHPQSRATKWEWILLFTAMCISESGYLIVKATSETYLFSVFLPTAVGGALGIFLPALLGSMLAKQKYRFQVCVWLSIIFWVASCIGRASIDSK